MLSLFIFVLSLIAIFVFIKHGTHYENINYHHKYILDHTFTMEYRVTKVYISHGIHLINFKYAYHIMQYIIHTSEKNIYLDFQIV